MELSKKRTANDLELAGHDSKKALLDVEFVVKLQEASWEVLCIVLPYIPRSMEVCKHWCKIMESEHTARTITAMRRLLGQGFRDIFSGIGVYTDLDITHCNKFLSGVGLAFQLLERGKYKLTDITREIQAVFNAPIAAGVGEDSKALQEARKRATHHIPYALGLGPYSASGLHEGMSCWRALCAGQWKEGRKGSAYNGSFTFAASMVETHMPESMMLVAVNNAIKNRIFHYNGYLPFFMLCNGVTHETTLTIARQFGMPPVGTVPGYKPDSPHMKVALSRLYPAYILKTEALYPGFINWIIDVAEIKADDMELVQWFFSQSLSFASECRLLKKILKFNSMAVDLKKVEFEKYIGRSLEHIYLSQEVALHALSKWENIGPILRFLLRSAKKRTDFDIQLKVLEIRRPAGSVNSRVKIGDDAILMREFLTSTDHPEQLIEHTLILCTRKMTEWLEFMWLMRWYACNCEAMLSSLDWPKLKPRLRVLQSRVVWLPEDEWWLKIYFPEWIAAAKGIPKGK